jgi:two-component system, cell cycle sensor histidine kinase and response regulator CckA
MTLRKIVAVLALFSLLSTSIGVYLYYQSAKDGAVREAEGELAVRTQLLADRIARLISTNQMEVRALALFEELRDALLETNSAKVSQADRILDHFVAGLGHEVCYLLDRSGNTIASTNRQKPDSFVGRNYSFRPYFRDALEGNPTTYLALGQTSGMRGIYFSHPVYQPGNSSPIGVVAVKAPIEDIERELSQTHGGIALLVHRSGMVFVSSRSEWLFHFLWQATPEESSRIVESKQFGEGPWNWTGLEKKTLSRAVYRSGEAYVVQERDIENCPGWKVVYLYDLRSMSGKLVDPLVGTTGYVALALVFLVLLAVVLLYRTAEKEILSRKRAEEALTESENKYRDLYENLRDGFVAISPHGKITEFNPAFALMLDYDADELRRLSYEDITPEFWHPMEAEIIRTQVLQRGYSDVYEKEYVRKDATIFPVELRAYLIPDERGGCAGMWAFVRDISDRKRVETVARNDKLRFEALAENAPFGLVMISEDGTFQYVNPKFQEIFGYDLKDVPNGQEWLRKAYPDPQYRKEVTQTWLADAKVTKQGEPRPRTFSVHCKDGSYKTINFIPVQLEKGEHLVACQDVTAIRRAEDALRQSENKLRAIAEHSTNLFYSHDVHHVLTYLSPQTREFFDCEPEEALTRWTELATDNPINLHGVEATQKAIDTGKRQPSYLLELQGMKGRKILVEVNESPVVVDGKTVAIVGSLTDVTERKIKEEALQESEQRLELTLSGADLGLWDWNVQTGEVVFNGRWAQMLGYTLEEIEPHVRSWEKLLHPEDTPSVIQALKSHLDGMVPMYETEHRLRTKSGDWVWVLDRGRVVSRDEQGAPLRAVGTHLDITARKSAEMALRKSEEKYRTILETIADGYHEVDLEGNLTLVNDSLCEILGYSRDELIGKSYRDLMDLQNAKQILIAYNAVFRSGVSNPEFSYQVARKDGVIRDVSVSIALMRDSAGTPMGFRGIFRDITERRHLEEQLRQAVKMEAIGRLAGGIAHDFNNLLTAIMGYTDMLSLEMPEDKRTGKKLDQINRAATRASDLTKQLLAFSRKQVLEVSIVNFNDLVGDVENMLRRLIGEDIELMTQLGQAIGNVRADQSQLEQVVMNLAVNARDAMPGGGTLAIETLDVVLDEGYCASHAEVKPGEYVLLCISDTGHGMTPETCSRVFDPFFTTKAKGVGTGLGLSTVYGIIKQHGGHVAVYSEVGRGTTFKIYLPSADEPLNSRLVGEETGEKPFGSETILLVEDEETVRDLAGEALEMLGYCVLRASSPTEAIGIAANHTGVIDLLLTDVVLPQMDGKTLYERLATNRSEMKVLYVSGYTENFIVHRGILDSEVSFLQKPFTLDSIARKVRTVLDQE